MTGTATAAAASVDDVALAEDPAAAVLTAWAEGRSVALRTSGTGSRPRVVVRTAASWVESFEAFSRLTGIGSCSRVWVPGPISATMNLFAATHARYLGAVLSEAPEAATHAHLTPAMLARCLRDGVDLRNVHVVVAGDRLTRALSERTAAVGARVSHYYGASELSFVAWGTHEDDLRAFPDVELAIRAGRIWARSAYICSEAGTGGSFARSDDGFATVGDRGRLDRHVLTVAGRGSEAVITAGVTVLVADVEPALQQVAVGEVFVVGVPHARLGAVVAAVLTNPQALTSVTAAARAQLSAAQRPRLYFHVPEPPLTSSGKVDRVALGRLVASRQVPRLSTAMGS